MLKTGILDRASNEDVWLPLIVQPGFLYAHYVGVVFVKKQLELG